MRKRLLLAHATALAALACATSAAAHAVVGNRFFPATLAADDPGVADELSLPTVSAFRPGDDPDIHQLDLAGEYSKRLTSRLGVSVEDTWTHIRGGSSGAQNLETTLKYQFLTDAPHEAILAAGVSYEWGGSGARGFGEQHSTVTPTVYFGKGAGDLPESLAWVRPFAVTGLAGYAVPTRGHDGDERNPRTLTWGLAVEYSLPYLASHVRDLGLPDVVNHLTPVVEAAFETPVGHAAGRTTGTINPGIIWTGRRMQVGAEAMLPIDHASGRGTGLLFQVHFYLDDIFPHSLGKPIW